MNEDLFEWLPPNELDYQYQTYIEKTFSKHLSSQNFSYVVIIYLIVMAVIMYKLQKNLIVVLIPAVLFCLLFIKSRKNSTHNNDEISQQNYEWREGTLTKIRITGRNTKNCTWMVRNVMNFRFISFVDIRATECLQYASLIPTAHTNISL